MFAIVMDSTSSISVAELNKMGIDVVSLTVNFGEESFVDGVDMTPEQFYVKMAEYMPQGLPKTACPAPGAFEKAYRDAAAAAEIEGVLVMTISAGLSECYSAAHVAAEAVAADGIRVEVIDSLSTSQMLAVMANKAVQMRDAGATLDEAVAHLQRMVQESRTFFALDGMENLVKGGRVGRAVGLAASALHIKPILEIEKADGKVGTAGKARGVKGLLKDTAALVVEADEGIEGGSCTFFSHANAVDRVAEIADAIEAAGIECDRAKVGWIGSVIGTHSGEGGVGVSVVPKALL